MSNLLSAQTLQLEESRGKYYLVLFLLWPFMAFVTAIFNYKNSEARKVVYIFLVYFGLTFAIGDATSDAYRYSERLQQNAEMPVTGIGDIFRGLYNSKTLDIAEPLVSFLVSRVTGFYGVFFAIWAGIFGFFYLKSINFLYGKYMENPGVNARIILVFFITIMPITYISGVRMYTAAWIFFYGAYHVIFYRDKKFLFVALSASLVHWSLLTANAILILYYFLGNRNIIYVPLAILSFFAPRLMLPVFQFAALRLGGGFQTRFEEYTGENYVLARQESLQDAAWFIRLGPELVFYFVLIAIIIIQLWDREKVQDRNMKNLFSFTLLFLAFRNFGITIPSFGSRFTTIFFLFATMYIFLYMVKLKVNKLHLLTWVGLFPMLLLAAINFRLGSPSINVWLFSPGFGVPLLAPSISLAELFFF